MNELDKLFVSQSDGTEKKIEQLTVNQSKTTLGLWTNSAGECSKQLKVLHRNIEI